MLQIIQPLVTKIPELASGVLVLAAAAVLRRKVRSGAATTLLAAAWGLLLLLLLSAVVSGTMAGTSLLSSGAFVYSITVLRLAEWVAYPLFGVALLLVARSLEPAVSA